MRLGTFLLGGILGAAAVVYLSRGNKNMMFTSWTQAGNAMNKMMDTVKNKMTGMGVNMDMRVTSSAAGTKNYGNDGLEKVQQIANHDPHVKQAVNDVLKDNNQGSLQSY